MKRILLSTVATIYTVSMFSQVVVDTVSTISNYANDVFYSLPNGIVSSVPKDNWDLAFQIGGQQDMSILANTQGTGRVYQSPLATASGSWDVATAPALTSLDTTGISSWQRLDNDPTDWNIGALNVNQMADGNWQDLGWGFYDFDGSATGVQHLIFGDSIFVIKTGTGEWKQFYVNKFSGGKFIFTFADLNGSNQVTDTISKADYADKNFAYYSLSTATASDREPVDTTWELLFTKYITFDYPGGVGTPQSVSGLLQNAGIEAVKAYPVDTETVNYEDYTSSFVADKNAIGYDWKSLNYQTFLYDVADSTVYFVKRANGDIWKLIFTGFGGSSTGNYIFNKELVYTYVDTTSNPIDTTTTGIRNVSDNFTALEMYPNPSQNFVNLVYDFNDSRPLNTTLNIFDLSGRLVFSQVIAIEKGLHKETLNISSLEAGMYSVSLSNVSEKTHKLIVQ